VWKVSCASKCCHPALIFWYLTPFQMSVAM
jgi:hypothetical protein